MLRFMFAYLYSAGVASLYILTIPAPIPEILVLESICIHSICEGKW